MIRSRQHRYIRKTLFKGMRFIHHNRLLVFLVSLILFGCLLGTSLYRSLSEQHHEFIGNIVTYPKAPHDLQSAVRSVATTSFGYATILFLLFISGLTAFGCPIVLLSVTVYGFWLGVSFSYAYSTHGWLDAFCYIELPMMFVGIAVVIMSANALRMTCVFSRQLLPSGAHCGGMWPDFKRYLIRFAISLILVVCIVILYITIQTVYLHINLRR